MNTGQRLKPGISVFSALVLLFTIVFSSYPPAVIAEESVNEPSPLAIEEPTADEQTEMQQTVDATYSEPSETALSEAGKENYALKKPVKVSGNEVDYGLFPEYAVDGNMGTRWSSAKTDDQWFVVDLGEAKDIGQVVIHWQTPAKTYKIYTSVDGEQWNNIKDDDGLIDCSGGKDVLDFPGRPARFVKFQGLERAPVEGIYYGYSFYEFQVFEEDHIAKIIQGITGLEPIAEGQTKLTLPEVPAGYRVSVYGSDALPVIDKDAVVHPPLVERKVHVILQVQNEEKPEEKGITASFEVTVPGIYSPAAGRNPEPKVIPSLREWVGNTGQLKLTPASNIVFRDAALQTTADILKEDLKDVSGLDLETLQGSPSNGDIYLTLDSSLNYLGAEGYALDIHDYASIAAPTEKGVLWGTRSVLQILKQDAGHDQLPEGLSHDYPKYETRGLMIDVARKFYTIDFLREYVKMLSWYKMTDLQIHLNDDVGAPFPDGKRSAFRLESDRYPGLASQDGYYTKEEFWDLQRLGRKYGINIIPEIDTPGHSRAFTTYDPSLGKDSFLDITKPAATEFITNLFDEYIDGYGSDKEPTFLGPDVHIGTDEYAGGSNEDFRKYMDTLIRHINDKGKHPYVWGGLKQFAGTTPVSNQATMSVWYEPYEGPQQAMDEGYDIINTDTNYMYLVPRLYRDYLDTPLLYREWEPVKWLGVTLPYGLPQLKGGMFALWNDISYASGISMDDSHARMLPAMQVLSEKMWQGARDGADYDAFMNAASTIGDAPKTDLSHRINVDNPDGNVINYTFEDGFQDGSGNHMDGAATNVTLEEGKYGKGAAFHGGQSYIQTPLNPLWFGWTASMWIKPDADNPDDAVLMESPNGTVKLKQGKTGKLGFSKEGYDSVFQYEVPANRWTHILLTGNQIGVSLYVNGNEYVEKLGQPVPLIQTLVLPAGKIGSDTNAFKGVIDNFQIYNRYTPLLDVNNFALQAKAESSPLEADVLTPDKAIDGNLSTRWSSAYDDASWMIIDLGQSRKINKINIAWETQAEKFKLLVSQDKQTWTNVKPNDEILRSNGKLDTIDFDPAEARYVKFQGVERRPVGDTKYGYSIYELEVYGDDLMVSYNETLRLAEQLLASGKGDPALRSQLLAMLDRYPYQFEAVSETLKDLVSRLKASIEEKPTDPGASSGGTTGSGGDGNAGGGGTSANVDEAEISLNPGKAGTLTLGDRVTIQIPADALKTPARLRIRKLEDNSSIVHDKAGAISPAYELTLTPGGSFEKAVRMSISYDGRNLSANQKASIFFYDPSSKKWVEVGGTAAASRIQADVMKTGIYAVFAVKLEAAQPDSVTFTDTARHWASVDIVKAVQLGIVTGYPDGMFRPDGKVTRAEFAAMLARALKLQGSGSNVTFKDAVAIGDWARMPIAQAVEAGIVNGYEDGTFRPNAFIQRDEMVTMIARALKLESSEGGKAKTAFADDTSIPAWAKNAIQAAALQGLIQGRSGNLFAADETSTRAEAVTIMLKAADYKSR
ncbi:discoidin domain-containing protein [Paenibacillus dokdonensis]|uniref:Discoidin domain-containing protein n=1 Tax=Paenibacillus dokdonensis TaxID=2567944 RepID=A0ABU6GPA5_9BACL|nr:discoidin domain-containing protein [Paenibacillus dokdonensis]MEC0240101.1 discoidin domain-containing protein [Paenibacillus dokdonensis]